MEFSQYILDVIESINYVTKDYDTNMVSLVRDASENAPSEKESHILDVIAGASTMRYKVQERSFGPHIIWEDGTRLFAPEDLQGDDLDILCGVIELVSSIHLRTKFSHIVWSLNKDNRYGEIAVTGYLDVFQEKFNPDNWVGCYEQIRSAYHIAITMGSKSESFKQTRTAINQKLIQMNGLDSSFLSLKLLELIIKDAPKEDFPKYDSIIRSLVARNLEPTHTNVNLADTTFSVLEKLYGRMKKEEEIKTARAQYASYYEAQAKKLAQKNDYFRAVTMLKKTCALYTGINQEKLLELRLLLEDWQKIALQEMHVHKFKIDIKPTYDAVEKMFEGLSLREAIVQFGRIAKIYHVDDIKRKLLENQEQYVFTSMFGSCLLNGEGQSVQALPSIKKVIDSGDSVAMRKHMVRYVAEQRR